VGSTVVETFVRDPLPPGEPGARPVRVHVFSVRGISGLEIRTEGSALGLPGSRDALVSARLLFGAEEAVAFPDPGGGPVPVEAVMGYDPGTDLARIRLGEGAHFPAALRPPLAEDLRGSAGSFRLWAADPVVPAPGALLRGELRMHGEDPPGAPPLAVALAGAAPEAGGALLDAEGEVIGILHPSFVWEETRLGVPLPRVLLEEPTADRLSVDDLSRLRYRGTGREALEQGLLAWREADFPAAVTAFSRLLREEPALADPFLDRILESYLAEANGRKGRGNLLGAIWILREAVTLLPREARLHQALGRHLLDQGDEASAIEELLVAVELDRSLVAELGRTIADLFLRRGDGEMRAGRFGEAAALAQRAVGLFPDEPSLLYLLGRALAALGSHADAVPILERALLLDGSLASAIQPLLSEAERMLGGGYVVEIRYPPNSRRIGIDLLVADRSTELFVLDTGATNTVITPDLAYRLGLPLDPRRRARVSTAGGVVEAPLVILPALEIKGLRVVNLEAVVLDLGDLDVTGLVGLDFLNHFIYSVDGQEGVLTLRAR
jgi:clan AA aspartic protease (TIGR02281 family)